MKVKHVVYVTTISLNGHSLNVVVTCLLVKHFHPVKGFFSVDQIGIIFKDKLHPLPAQMEIEHRTEEKFFDLGAFVHDGPGRFGFHHQAISALQCVQRGHARTHPNKQPSCESPVMLTTKVCQLGHVRQIEGNAFRVKAIGPVNYQFLQLWEPIQES